MLRLRRRTTRVLVAGVIAASLSAGAFASPAAAAPLATYKVVGGDSISLIAMKLKVKVKDLLATNDLTINSVIHPGDILDVPAGGVAPSAPPASVPAPPATYTVVWGDSLIGIAKSLKVTLSDLLTLNKLTTKSLIYPGMKLKVPASTTAPAASTTTSTTIAPKPAPSPGVYVVVAGDFLGKIAKLMKVSLVDLMAANKLTLKSVIFPGDRLVVPAGGVVPGAPTSSSSSTTAPAPSASPAEKVVAFAMAQIGKPYKFNTAGPATYDCSGLTLAAYAEIGVSLPHYSGAQSMLGSRVDLSTGAIKPGDLVFLETSPGSGVIGHVGIAVSATEWVQAPRTGEFVRKSTIPMHRVVAVRRFVEA